MSKVTSFFKFLGSKAKAVGRFFAERFPAFVAIVVFVLMGIMAIRESNMNAEAKRDIVSAQKAADAAEEAADSKPYILIEVVLSNGSPALTGSALLVSHMRHFADGALCFYNIKDDNHGCIKGYGYYLREFR